MASLGSIFSGPKTPTIIAPATAPAPPTPNSKAIQQAQQQQAASAAAQSGRQATILTDKENKFGG